MTHSPLIRFTCDLCGVAAEVAHEDPAGVNHDPPLPADWQNIIGSHGFDLEFCADCVPCLKAAIEALKANLHAKAGR